MCIDSVISHNFSYPVVRILNIYQVLMILGQILMRANKILALLDVQRILQILPHNMFYCYPRSSFEETEAIRN